MTCVLACGGRDYADQARVDYALDLLHLSVEVTRLVHGDATGADSLAADWARRRGIPPIPYPADWEKIDHPKAQLRWSSRFGRLYDAKAGLRRNIQMLEDEDPDFVVAFPGGTGTAHMVEHALLRGIPVIDVDP